MSAVARIATDLVPDVLLVPSESVFQRDGHPIVYRLDLSQANSALMAKRFPVRDRDIIFIAEAKTVPVTRALQALSLLAGPVTSGLLVCQVVNKC